MKLVKALIAVVILGFNVWTNVSYAAQCSAVFPSNNSLATNSSANVHPSVKCDGGRCTPLQGFEIVTPFPSISPSGSFTLNSISDGVYQHTSWGLGFGQSVNFSDSGTAVIYFNGSVIIPPSTNINVGGSPSNVLIVVNGSMVVHSRSQINAHIYVRGATYVGQNVSINGSLSTDGSIMVDRNASFEFDASDVTNLDGHGFCDGSPPPPVLTCDAADAFDVVVDDDFSSNSGYWGATDFNRSVSNWPGESIYNSFGENQTVIWNITGNELRIQGAESSGGDNEYGMVEYDLAADNIDASSASNFSVKASFDTNSSSATNNDLGIVFGYQDDNNYYLARWTAVGTSYSGSTPFPGDFRQLDLVKVSRGVATILDSSSESFGENMSMMVVATDDGVGVCTGGFNDDPSDMTLKLFTSETPALQNTGIYSYDNDVGIEADNFEVRCDDCEVTATVKADFRFDECSYSGLAGEVVDQLGNYSGVVRGGASSLDAGQIERAIDINHYSHYVETLVPLATTFTISTWFKKPTSNTNSRYFILGAMESGGDLLYIDRNNSWRWGVYVPGKGAVNGSYSFNSLDNNWHHMVLVYSEDQTRLYIDGVFIESINIAPSGNLKYIGTSYDSVGSSAAQGFRAPLDEFLVFDGAMSPAIIANLYSYQSAGKNYDNTDRDEVVCDVSPLAFYQFEQDSFSPNIIDATGNGNFATNFGGTLDNDSKYCRGFSTGSDNFSSAVSNAFESSLDIDDDIGERGTVSFWFNSSIDWDDENERILFDASECNNPSSCNGSDKYFTLEIRSDGRLKFNFEDSSDRDFSISEPSTSVRSADTWYYITTTWDYIGNNFQIYVDGDLEVETSVSGINGDIDDLGNIVFGDNSSNYTANGNSTLASPISSHGRFDEVKIYNSVISRDQILLDMDGIDCDNDPLFLFTHDGAGITCLSENVAVKACTDASCTTTDTNVNATIDMLVNGGNTQSVNIVNGVGTASFNYTDTVNNAILSSTADYLCTNTSLASSLGQTAADCGLSFSDTGFVTSTIDNQIAGVGFDGITIRAVQANDTGACSALFNNTTDIGFAMQYQTPTTTTSNNYTINGTAIVKSVGSPSSYTDISVNFNAAGVGIIPTNTYFDAGQVQLHVQKVIPATADVDAVTINGNSNNFWVRPDRFEITSPLVGATGIHAAGDDFNYEINAVNRQGNTTTNYLVFDIEASVQRVAPVSADGVNGDFTFSNTIGSRTVGTAESFVDTSISFTNGIATISTAEYSEVGIISLDVRENDYGGVGLRVDANSVNLGRFTPAYFTQTVSEHGSIMGQCGNWAYSGQLDPISGNGVISYDTLPVLHISAHNEKGAITRNYRNFGAGDNFAQLNETDFDIASPTQDIAQNGALGTLMLLTGSLSHDLSALAPVLDTGAIPMPVGGEFTYTFNNTDHFTYTRDLNAVFTPFNAQFDITIANIADADGVIATTRNNVNITSDVEIRFGRLRLENSYGPETSDLPQPFVTEYLTDIANLRFSTNQDDNCSAISDNAIDWNITNGDTSKGLTAAMVNLAGSAGTMTNGQFDGVELTNDSSPTVQGSVGVEFTTPPWLRFDWDGDGIHDNNASAIATFGRYRGNDRIIYWKEVNNN